MLRVYACLVEEHDLRLVLVAGLICLLSAFTAFSILEQARHASRRRPVWLAAIAFVSGTGIWSTHFIAMLAYEPNLPVGYDVGLTLLSVTAAILITGIGWSIALSGRRWAPIAAGPFIAAGIGTMHYIGMSAVTLSGQFLYDRPMVAASVLVGGALAAAAVADHFRRPRRFPIRPALLLTLAICGLHFTAMGAASILPDPRIPVPAASIESSTLAVAVILMALVILAISFATVLFDRALDRRSAEEALRLKTFADAAIEGLLIVDGERVIDANHSFRRLAALHASDLTNLSLPTMLPDLDLGALRAGGAVAETRLLGGDGQSRDVEILARPLEWQGAQLRVLAVRDISDRKEAAARIAHLAYHDALTGLPNRTVFTTHLAAALDDAAAAGEAVAVLCIDLDGFKAINDLHGHPAGDELLIEAAQRLRSLLGQDALAARLGGDEFAIVQRGGEQPHRADLLAQKVLAALGSSFVIAGRPVGMSCSLGVALYPADAATPGDLVKNADMALYRAKADGRGVARFYESRMDDAVRERRLLEADLHLAMGRNELSLHYQPLADLESGRILGFEALLRWRHPVRGDITPGVFIPLAEESGFIAQLGAWALRRACREAASWEPALRISVNLSPVQFLHGDLAAEVEQVLEETGLDPARLDLEITEGVLIKNPDRALDILRRLKALGVEISIDDFGTGYSSLSYFRMFPFDKVKIDQSFVRDMIENPQARAIVRSVIGLGRGLGMPVVAEGVETSDQLDALLAEGCDQVQGYLISRPGPIEQFERVVIDRDAALAPDAFARRACSQ